MSKIGVFLSDGCEEIEALTVVDVARRAGIEVTTLSITGAREIMGSHKIPFVADELCEGADFCPYDGIVLPGGMPGTVKLSESETVQRVVKDFAGQGKLVAAICAAPGVVLGASGYLKGRRATCHPGFEDKLLGAEFVAEEVVRDGNFITSRGMGTAIAFALEIVRYLLDDAAADKVAGSLVYRA